MTQSIGNNRFSGNGLHKDPVELPPRSRWTCPTPPTQRDRSPSGRLARRLAWTAAVNRVVVKATLDCQFYQRVTQKATSDVQGGGGAIDPPQFSA